MDPILMTILIAMGVDIANDKIPVLRNLTHGGVINAAVEKTIPQMEQAVMAALQKAGVAKDQSAK